MLGAASESESFDPRTTSENGCDVAGCLLNDVITCGSGLRESVAIHLAVRALSSSLPPHCEDENGTERQSDGL